MILEGLQVVLVQALHCAIDVVAVHFLLSFLQTGLVVIGLTFGHLRHELVHQLLLLVLPFFAGVADVERVLPLLGSWSLEQILVTLSLLESLVEGGIFVFKGCEAGFVFNEERGSLGLPDLGLFEF